MVDSNNNGAVTCTFLTSYPFPSTARPAFNLDPNSVLFTSAAAGGKASGAVGENALESVSEYSGSEWKLTLKDDRRSFTAETTATTIEAGQSLSISYSGAQTGDNEYVSVLLCDSADNVLYYGNIAGNSADGTASVTIPAVLDPDSYTLKVFSEQCNGDKKTDYASAFVNISLTVTEHIHRYGTDWKTDADKHWHECSCGAKADEADHKYDDRRDTTCNVCGYVRAAYYILTVDLQGGNGSAADGEYAEGAVINIDAGTRPNYHFSGWISSNGGSFADASSQGTTFTMPATDTTITANWQYEGGGPNKAIQIGASQIEGGQASNIYFGTYMQSRASAGVYNIDPIKWRVLSNADGKLFLLSNQNLDVLPYNGNQTSVTWENCTLRSWLNGTFLKSALSDDEQGAIDNTYVYNATQSDGRNNPNPSYSTPGGNNTTDKIFLLSIEEANNSSYFPNADSRISTNTAYVVSYYGMSGAGEADGWWLRSPGRLDNTAAFVEASGDVYHSGSFVDIRLNAVRPAFNLDQNAVLFTSAAVGGKSSGSVGTDALQSVSDDSGSEWKLTLLDEGRGSFSVSGASMSGGTVSFSYSGAQTGTDEYLSAVVVENGAVTHYGRILQLDGTAGGESGTASLSLPAGVTLSGNTKLYVFNEQYNGDKKTGYASDLVDIIPAVSADGREVELRANDTHIQWKYVDEGDDAWRDLVALSALTGGDGSDGADGREIELQNNGTTIQWRYKGDTTWNDLVDLSALTGAAGQDGADGREIELQNNGTTIQWRYVGETEWKDLVDLSALTGATGQDGKDGQDGADGTDGREVELRVDGGYIQWRYTTGSDTEWKNLIAVSALQGLKGDKGDKGDPGADGQDGKDGQDGSDGVNGKNGIDGKTAATGRTAQTAKTVKMALGLPALRSTTAASWSLPLPTAQKKISAR